jgi:hypothetical protein
MEVGSSFNPTRFMPFVVMHEFEGLLFSDCPAFCQGIGRPDLELQFQQIRNDFETPEDINDSPITCPSKRVKNLVPGYEKPLYGTLAALEVGLSRIRTQCPHFDSWLRQLESLAYPMFENLQEKLQRAFKNLRGQARLTEENIAEACAKFGWRCSKPTSTSKSSKN